MADVHALRSAFVTLLMRAGANVKAVQLLARHSDPRLTVGLYSRFDPKDAREGLARAPDLSPNSGAQRATGTDGWTARGTGSGSERCGSVHPPAHSTPQEAAEQAAGCPGRGGDEGSRTLDLCVANAALYQLSYVPGLKRENKGRRA